MSRIAYVNGRYQPLSEPAVPAEDRGLQFADGVYEVYEVRGGRIIDEERHARRLARSLGELRIRPPMSDVALGVVLREVLRRNRVVHGTVYLQVNRGVAPRNHPFPAGAVRPSMIVTARPVDEAEQEQRAEEGVAVITLPESRWARVDIKSVSLLPNVLAKQAAREAGAWEAWFVDSNGKVTEGASSNAWIVTAEGELVTTALSKAILPGITRSVVLELAARLGQRLVERSFSVAEARAASEAFMTSATSLVTPIVRIDGQPIGDGRPGKTAAGLRQALRQRAAAAPQFAAAVASSAGML